MELNESPEPALPKDDVGDDDQRSCEVAGGNRPFIQPGAGDSTTLPNGGPIAPSVVMPVCPQSVEKTTAARPT